MKLQNRTGIALLLALTVIVAACASGDVEDSTTSTGSNEPSTTVTTSPNTTNTTDAVSGEPIVVGQAIALTGWAEPFDGPPAIGSQFAADDINAVGGVLGRPIEFIQADNTSTVEGSTQAGIEVVEGGADFVIAECDFDLGAPAARVAQDAGLVAFSTCAGSPSFGVSGIGELAFTMGTVTPTEGAIGAEWSASQGWERPYILTDTLIEYSTTQCDFFKERWNELEGVDPIAGEDTFQNGDQSVSTQVNRLANADPAPDFIYLCTFPPGGPSVILQIRNAGIDIPIVSGFGMDGTYWLEAVPDLSDFYNTSYGSLAGDDPDPRVNEFFARYENETGARPATSAALTGYAVIEALALAAERAGTLEGSELAAALETFNDEDLIVGPTSFTETFHFALNRSMRIVEIQGGDLSFVEVWLPESVPTP